MQADDVKKLNEYNELSEEHASTILSVLTVLNEQLDLSDVQREVILTDLIRKLVIEELATENIPLAGHEVPPSLDDIESRRERNERGFDIPYQGRYGKY